MRTARRSKPHDPDSIATRNESARTLVCFRKSSSTLPMTATGRLRAKATRGHYLPIAMRQPPSARPPGRRSHLSRQEGPRERGCHVFYQAIKSLRVACCGDESIAGFEHGLRNVLAPNTPAARGQTYNCFLIFFFP